MFENITGILPQNWSRGAQIGAVVGGAAIAAVAAPVLGFGTATLLAIAGGAAVGATTGAAIEKKYLLAMANDSLGISPPPITITLKKETIENPETHAREEKAVFTFDDVTTFNIDEIRHAVSQFNETTENAREIERYNFQQKPRYRVTLIAKKEMTLAELDYSDSSAFYTVVTDKDGHIASEEETKKVLTTLDVMPKFLGAKLTDPEAVATDVIDESKSRLGDWFRRNLLGRTNRIIVDPTAAPDTILEEEDFFDRLLNVATKTGKYREILGHYKNTLIAQYRKNHTLNTEAQKVKEHVNNSFGFLFKPSALQFVIGIAIVVGFTIIAFIPGVNIVAAAICVTLAFIFTIWKGAQLIDKFLENRRIRREKQAFEKKITEFENKFAGFDRTNQAIETCTTNSLTVLSLENREISATCVKVIGRWISSTAGDKCTELRLSKNNITAEGAKLLASSLKDTSHIQILDLSNNPIGEEGLTSLKDALQENFTVTTLLYDAIYSSESNNQEIKKQLLINKYLQGDLVSEDDLRELFTNKDALLSAAKNKIATTENLYGLQAIKDNTLPSPEAVKKELAQALVQAQLKLIFERNDSPAQQLANYIALQRKVASENLTTINLTAVNQETILKLVKITLFKKERELVLNLDKSSPVINTLVNMKGDNRAELLARCIESIPTNSGDPTGIDIKKHAQGIANLTSKLIAFEGTFDPENTSKTIQKVRKCIEKIVTWGVVHDPEQRWKFNQYIEELKSLLNDRETPPADAKKIENIIQSSIQKDLEARYDSVNGGTRDDYDALRTELSSNFDLKKFKFDESGEEFTPQIETLFQSEEEPRETEPSEENPSSKATLRTKNLLQHTCSRNMICYSILHGNSEQLLQGVANDTDLKLSLSQIEQKIEKSRANINIYTQILKLIQEDVGTNVGVLHGTITKFSCEKLRALREDAFITLFEHCVDEENKEDARKKAFLIHELLGIKELFDRENLDGFQNIISDIYWSIVPEGQATSPYYDYATLKSRLESHLTRAPRELAEKIREKMQNALQAYLTDQFECLKGTLDHPLAKSSSFDALKKELKENYELTKFSRITCDLQNFPRITDEQVKKYVSSICHRNLALKALEHEDAETFLQEFKLIDDSYCEEIISSLKPETRLLVLKNIAKDLGTSVPTSRFTGEYTTTLTCAKLKDLSEKQRMTLLTQGFMYNDNEENAKKKAKLISNILKIDELYDPNKQSNKLIQDINYYVYYSIATWGTLTTNNYNFDKTKAELEKIVQKLKNESSSYPGTPPELREEILKKLEKSLASMNTLAPTRAEEQTPHPQLSPAHRG